MAAHQEDLSVLVDRLVGSMDELVAEQCRVVFEFPSYATVPPADVERSARRTWRDGRSVGALPSWDSSYRAR
jgi:hypothetical protein